MSLYCSAKASYLAFPTLFSSLPQQCLYIKTHIVFFIETDCPMVDADTLISFIIIFCAMCGAASSSIFPECDN